VFGTHEPPTEVVHRTITPAEAGAERERLRVAIAASIKQLNKLRARLSILPEDSQAEIAPLLAGDGKSLSADDRASMARRAEEVREIARRVVRNLTHTPFRSFAGLPEGAVLVCEWLRPSDAALLDPTRLAGVATDEGGGEGHTAVMLRALGMPAVLGADGLSHAIAEGDEVVVDGAAGVVILNPTPQTTAEARQAVAAFARERQRYARMRRLPAETTDGEPIELQANLELPIELAADCAIRRARRWPAAHRVPVHEPRGGARRRHPGRDLSHDRRGDGRRYGDDPRARLGWREGHRGVAGGRHRAGDCRHEPGAGRARHPPAAAPARAVRAATGGHPARRRRRAGACAAADDHQRGRGAYRAGDLRARRAADATVARAPAGQVAAARRDDRDAGGGAERRRAGVGGGFHCDRDQRPDRLHAGGGSRQGPSGRAVRSTASGGAASDPVRDRSGVAAAQAGVGLRRDGGQSEADAAADRARTAQLQHE